MEFKELEKEVRDGLGEELKQLAKDYMKDQYQQFQKRKKQFERDVSNYNEILSTEITEEYLKNQGYSIKDTRNY